MLNKSGVYKITCIPTGKFYIGSAANFKNRWRQHKNCANNNKHHSVHFQRAWEKYGQESFLFSILLVCEESDMLMFEQKALDAMRPKFNVCPTAGSRLGTKQSAEARAKMSASQTGLKQSRERVEHRAALCRGRKRSSEAIERTAAALRGIPRSAEIREKLAAANRGRKCSDALKIKLSTIHKGNTYSLGKVHSLETRARMSAGRVGHVVTEETRARIGNANRGKVRTAAHREAMSIANKGRKLSAETIAKMSASKKGAKFSAEHRSNMGVSSRLPVYIGSVRHVSRSAAARQFRKSVTTISNWVALGRVPSGNGEISGLPVGAVCDRSAS